VAGHRAGTEALRRTVEAAPAAGVGTLTLFAFSSDNWQRPAPEVAALMSMLGEYLDKEVERCVENGIRVEVIGRRDRLNRDVAAAIARAEARTATGERLRLRIAIDYSARDAILGAARMMEALSRDGMARVLGPEVDLLIRTGGEQRLSDFLLWECAYAELLFVRKMWPDFDAVDLEGAVREFQSRDRRFGRVPLPPPSNRHSRWLWLD
jgi:undecaprenyl diphosphate synthase